ncbi:MAG: XdhC family protein [Chloroflexi bacterium]|nr:XdhC family protein [Chloroflexota bacterium]MBV9131906.1 XdhC family protein [Chloroflexota bacterium]MBV9894989.1 XdhC family protein [Chloroflexota bacterium]
MTLGVAPGELLERAAALRRDGQPFVIATVVRSIKPASARPGDRALLVPESRPIGWVGGGCVHTAIEREAALALSSGESRLVRLSPTPREEEGVVNYPMTCHSGGTLEIYLEPVLPPPELVVLGESPVADALAALARPLGFRVRTSLDDILSQDVWVVAAAMSSDEDHPLVRSALAAGARYVAMVASRRRAEALRGELQADGIAEDVLDRMKAPAGLDLGAATAPEIALSILAEIVQLRRSRTQSPRIAERATAIDPICGMTVDVASAKWTVEKDGQTYYFCAPGCRRAFLGT